MLQGMRCRRGSFRAHHAQYLYPDSSALTESLYSYWADDEHTKEVMKKDETGTLWIHTGDKGIIDKEGYLSGKSI